MLKNNKYQPETKQQRRYINVRKTERKKFCGHTAEQQKQTKYIG